MNGLEGRVVEEEVGDPAGSRYNAGHIHPRFVQIAPKMQATVRNRPGARELAETVMKITSACD